MTFVYLIVIKLKSISLLNSCYFINSFRLFFAFLDQMVLHMTTSDSPRFGYVMVKLILGKHSNIVLILKVAEDSTLLQTAISRFAHREKSFIGESIKSYMPTMTLAEYRSSVLRLNRKLGMRSKLS